MGTFAAMMNSIMGAVQQSATNPPHAQSPDGQPNVRVFTGGGPNFQYTATTRLAPRNANDPQAHAQNVDVLPLPELLSNFLQPSPRGAGPEPAFAPLGFGNLFANLFNPANAQHGDAVYSQEAFDRIISQLMDQNHANNAPGPASSEAIAALPQRRIAKEDVDESTGKADCSICMDEAPIGSQVTYLPCSHWFHADCIRAWLGEHDTCPHCRQGIMARDGPEDATRPREPGQAPRHDRTWGQAEGSRQDPINMSESPTQQRTSADAASATGTTSGATLFSRMRDAFGGGGNDTPPPPPGTS
jgi:E3 ubiquitin-protein ligase RNF115/126